MAFADWLTEVATSRIVLAEIQPAEVLGGWTAVGGATPNVYSRTFSSFVLDTVVAGGVYRRLDKVRENATNLTSRASVADVNANLGSYYYDATTSTLYVSTTTGSDPDLFAALLAFFTLFVATAPKDFVGGELYEPRLVGQLPSTRSERAEPLLGVHIFASGDISLNNADKFFDVATRQFVWKNKLVTVKLGGGDLAYADYETITVMRIQDLAPGDDLCRLSLRSMASILERILPLNTYTSASFPNLGDGVEGTYRPLLYGAKTDLPAVLRDRTAGAQVYEVADPTVQVLTAISAVRAVNRATGVATTLSTPADYSVSLAGCTVTVTNATYDASTYQIRVDATGETNGAGGYLKYFGEIVEDILLNLGEDAANIDTASLDAADVAAPLELGVWMRAPKSAATYVRLLERSVLGSTFIGRTGQWTGQIFDPTYDASTIPELNDEDFVTWRPDDKIENIFPLVRVYYDENPATGAKKEKTSSNDTVRYAYETSDSLPLETALKLASDAETLAQRYRLIAGTPSIEVEIGERGLSLMKKQVCDKVAITRARAPSLSGAWSRQIVEILRIEKHLDPVAVSARIGDLFGLGATIGRWTSSSAPDYASASSAERETDGYWSDSDGYVVPGDASTKDISVWW